VSKIKAILFDMDGVLVDAKNWHYEALNRALSLFGAEINRQDHLKTYDGLPTRRKLEILSAEKEFPRALHPLICQLKQQYTISITFSRCRPVQQQIQALSKFKSQGYRLAVCSNSVRESVRVMMEQSNLLQYLEFFLSNQDVTLSKPDPEIYNVAIAKLKLDPTECLILEDNKNGIEAALSSGAHLMKISSVNDVNYNNISKRIGEIDAEVQA